MTRRRFYAPPAAFAPGEKSVILAADETRHARDVLRLQPGDEIFVFDGTGREFQCAVETSDRASAGLRIIAQVPPTRPESPLDLTLAIAFLKSEKFDLVVQKATELGVSRIVPLDTVRTDVRLRNSEHAHTRLSRWRRLAREAAKQSGRAVVPEIAAPLTLESLLMMDPGAPETASAAGLYLMFSERNGRALSEVVQSLGEQSRKIIAVVGPEGGWSDDELELAREADWHIVTLGGRTLRAETAAIVVTALLQHVFGDLS